MHFVFYLFLGISKIDRKDLLKEVNILKNGDIRYLVHYFDSWIQNNNCLYIQTELCQFNLEHIIKEKSKFFARTNSMDAFEYYISCKLFEELLECVQHLHESTPPIIHGNLKPQNVLVNERPLSGRYLLLCDFGAALFDSLNTVTHTQKNSSRNYRDLIVKKDEAPNTKYDIYSLGLICQDLFEIDSNT